MKRKQITIRKVKRPTSITPRWWDMLEQRGYLKTLQKLGKEGKLELNAQDFRNLREMQQVHKNAQFIKEKEENKMIKDIRDYFLALRQKYIVEGKGTSKIENEIGSGKHSLLNDIRKVGWKVRPRHKTNYFKDVIEILKREKKEITPNIIKNFGRAYYVKYKEEFSIPSRGYMGVLRKKLLKLYEEGKLKKMMK